MKSRMHLKQTQSGVMLLESLIGLLVFSFGILAFIGMQANAIRNTTETKYRSDASFLTSQLISTITADKANVTSYAYEYIGSGTVPTKLTAWATNINNTLPGAGTVNTANFTAGVAPKITIGNIIGVTRPVTVELHWQLPGANIRTFKTVFYIDN